MDTGQGEPGAAPRPRIAGLKGAFCRAEPRVPQEPIPRIADSGNAQTISAWSTNLTTRVVRRPKVVVADTGLGARLLGARIRAVPELAGRLIETFVGNELRAQAEWSWTRPGLFHFRDRDGLEVDLLLEPSPALPASQASSAARRAGCGSTAMISVAGSASASTAVPSPVPAPTSTTGPASVANPATADRSAGPSPVHACGSSTPTYSAVRS
ncbi:MAG: DUF4143 domain-containing protein [Pseudonocardia sp.]